MIGTDEHFSRLSLVEIYYWIPGEKLMLKIFCHSRNRQACALSGFIAILVSFPAMAADLSGMLTPARWKTDLRDTVSVKPERVARAMGTSAGIRFTGKATEKKVPYVPVRFVFKTPVDMSDLRSISFFAKSSRKLALSMTLECKGGAFSRPFGKVKPVSGSFRRYEFARKDFIAKGTPDITRIRSIIFGLGLYTFDTTRSGFELTFAKFTYQGTDDIYVLPLPKRGIAIDGQYKDWGYEDSLYNWYPPDYIHLNRKFQVVPGSGTWKGLWQLSGRIAMMMDDKNLYVLAIVADSTPFAGTKPHPWNNDSLELFIFNDAKDSDIHFGKSMKKGGIQLIFNCGEDLTLTQVILNGKTVKVPVQRKTIAMTAVVADRQAKGYVLEASMALADLGIKERVRGSRIAYSIKLNDATGLSLIATPRNLSPNANIKNFKTAFIEIATEKKSKITFGPLAPEVTWPEQYAGREGDIPLWNMQRCAYRKQVSTTTRRTYLHGFWACQVVEDNNAGPDPKAWFYAPLPMGLGWYSPAFFYKYDNNHKYVLKKICSPISLTRGKSFFWFERTFTIDPGFEKGKLYLVFEYVQIEASVYLNKKFLGTVDQAHTTLEITGKVKRKEPNRLDVFLYSQMPPGYGARNGMGLTGDIYLEHRDHAPVIRDIWVKNASGMNGALQVVVEKDSRASGNDLELETEVIRWRPPPQKERLTGRSPPAENSEVLCRMKQPFTADKTVLNGVCDKFLPWSPEHPDLFLLRMRCRKGDTIIDERIQRFGFRTFAIKNGRFMLNNKILRLRAFHFSNPSQVCEPGRLDMYKRYGHNNIFMHACHFGYNEPLFQRCDEVGLVVFAATNRSWPRANTVAEIRRYRSHPCVIGYVSDSFGQLNGNAFMHNPFSISDTYYPETKGMQSLYAFLRTRHDLFRSIDPTRPYFPHATGNFEGSLRSNNHYPTFGLNLIDRMMYFVPWAGRSLQTEPYHLYECGTQQLSVDSERHDQKFPIENGRMVYRRLTYEQASQYIGPAALDNWISFDARFMQYSIRGFRLCGMDGFMPFINDDLLLAPCNSSRAQDIKDRRRLSYRYFLLPRKEILEDDWMRMNSWYYKLRGQAHWQWPERFGQGRLKTRRSAYTYIYENEMQPLFACIVGPVREPYTFGHNYFSRERINKQIAIINDTEESHVVDCRVRLTIGGEQTEKKYKISVPQGAIVKQPFFFVTPAVKVKTYGRLVLKYVNPAGEQKQDTLEIAVFPETSSRENGFFQADAERHPWLRDDWHCRIGVIGEKNRVPLAARMGLPFIALHAGSPIPADLDLLIIERDCLNDLVQYDSLEKYINNGGQALILEQSNRSILDWRVREVRLEQIFIADRKHPVLAGLANRDFAYFRGPARIVPREKRPSRYYRHGQSTALLVPHLTNQGIVAGYVFEKPCYGSFRPILVGGYDLKEAALIEMRSGRGRAIFCQVDVTDRYGFDPAATRLLDNMVGFLGRSRPRPKEQAVAYLGGPTGRKFLERLGIASVKAGEGDEKNPVLVVGDGDMPQDRTFMLNRKTIIVLPFSKYLPTGVKTGKLRIQQLDHPHYWSTSWYQFSLFKSRRPAPDRLGGDIPQILRGLMDMDLYFFESPKLTTYAPGDGDSGFAVTWHSKHSTIIIGRLGNAEILLCAVDPGELQNDECRVKAWRIWSQIFANLNIINQQQLTFSPPVTDISLGDWRFITDPDGSGVKTGFPLGDFGKRKARPIAVGQPWEEQGVVEKNPNKYSGPDSSYDGFAWYFRKVILPDDLKGKPLYLHVNGIRDIRTFKSTVNQSDLWINGKKMPAPVVVMNAKIGGRGARVWKIDTTAVKYGRENLVAIRIYNDLGPGGIHRKPVRFETTGKNPDMLFPYEFNLDKYNPYYFWAW